MLIKSFGQIMGLTYVKLSYFSVVYSIDEKHGDCSTSASWRRATGEYSIFNAYRKDTGQILAKKGLKSKPESALLFKYRG